LMRHQVDLFNLTIICVLSVSVFILGGLFFMKIKRSFGDVL